MPQVELHSAPPESPGVRNWCDSCPGQGRHELWLANCCFAHDSSGFPDLSQFFGVRTRVVAAGQGWRRFSGPAPEALAFSPADYTPVRVRNSPLASRVEGYWPAKGQQICYRFRAKLLKPL